MARRRNGTVIVLSSAVLAVACVSPPERELSRSAARFASLPNGHDPLNPQRLSPIYPPDMAKENFARRLERVKGRPLNALSLSGGGQNGAFGAGFLIGWRERGDRPPFDFVVGVSTGALLATHAYLGTPADDAILEEMYTTVDRDDIYEPRGILGLASGADSLMDTAPLKRMIAKYITAETLERVAETAARDQRMLFVGTTNVDYGQTWIWNMALIAEAGELELYREVLRASSAFPIVFPPVEIDGHLFVDGAARSNIVVPGTTGTEIPPPPLHGPGNFFLIENGKVRHPPEALRRALGDIAAKTIGVMMEAAMQAAVTRSYFAVKLLGYRFHMVGIPEEVAVGKDPLAFDPEQMQAAFDAGRNLGRQDQPWARVPPRTGDLPDWADKAIHQLR